MDRGGFQAVYMNLEHRNNSSIPNGYPTPSPHEQYGAPLTSANQVYTPAPVSLHPPSAPHEPTPTGLIGAPRRKQLRAILVGTSDEAGTLPC